MAGGCRALRSGGTLTLTLTLTLSPSWRPPRRSMPKLLPRLLLHVGSDAVMTMLLALCVGEPPALEPEPNPNPNL